MSMKTIFRISSSDPKIGLWYLEDGKFVGTIEEEYTFCRASKMKMDFDPELVRYRWICNLGV